MGEKSTLGKLLIPLMTTIQVTDRLLPTTLPGPVSRFTPQMIEVMLPLANSFAAYFKILKEGFAGQRKVILHPFNFPPEILHAMDTAPVFVELLSTVASFAPKRVFPDKVEKYLDHGYESGLPGTLCAGQLGGAGAMMYGDVPVPDLILSGAPGFCDVNSKIMEYTARTLDVPLLNLDISSHNDQRGLDYYRQSFRHMISRLEEFTGNKLDEDRLRETVENTNQVIELGNEIFELQAAVPSPIPSEYNFFNMAVRFSMGGRPEAINFFKGVLNSALRKMKKGEGALREEKVRCLWLYTGVYFDPLIYLWLRRIGMNVSMDILSYFPVQPIDTTSMDTMIDGLAEEALNFPMIRQMKGALDAPGSWIEDMVSLARKFKVDCCIFFNNPACKRAGGSYRLLSDRIKKEAGVPVLKVEADAWDSRLTSMAEIKEKVESFLETVI